MQKDGVSKWRPGSGLVRGVVGITGLLVVIGCARWFYLRHGANFVAETEISWSFIIIMSLLILSFQLLAGVRMKLLTGMFGLRLAPYEWIGLAQMTTFFNYLPFKGGAVAGALFLKGAHNFSYTRFLATAAASSVLAVVTFSVVGSIGLAVLWLYSGVFSWPILAIYFSLIIVPLVFFLRLDRRAKRIQNPHLLRFLDGWRVIRTGGKRLLLLITTDLCMVLIDSMRITLCLGAVGLKPIYAVGLIVIPLSNILGVVSMVPGGLGVKEFTMGLLSSGLGIDFTRTIYAATLDRMILFLWVLFLGPLFVALIFLYRGFWGEKRLKK
jgi:glycosyltransferase 2 family protein